MLESKTLLRIGSFALALMLAMLGFVVYNTMQVGRYRRQLEANYTRSLQELSSQMNAISVDLQKSAYAGTPAQLSFISAKVWKDAAAAKAAVGNLPSDEADLTDVYRFLSQVGDYSMYLCKKTLNGEELTREERENYEALAGYSSQLALAVADVEARISSGQSSLTDLVRGTVELEESAALPVSLDMGEQQMDSYPSLIYDGPFSDHIQQHTPTMTEGQALVSQEKARATAADYAGIGGEAFADVREEASSIPSYVFSGDGVTVGVTKAGGFVTYLLRGRDIGGRALSIDQGRALAREWLEQRGIGAMRESYYELSNGVLTINYAYTQEDVVCYTDLIKVGVAMDDGSVVFYDARGYINNHRERQLPQSAALTVSEALEVLSPNLKAVAVSLALVPTSGKNEALTYEFRCTGLEGEDVLVYVNVDTGAEEQILILIESPNGTLTI